MNTPLISILIPVYNGAAYLQATVESILASTERNFEAIFVDDLSTDDSVAILQRFAANDPRVKILRRETKGGNASKGITYGLPHCKGRYFFYMSQDDLLSPDCLEKCVRKAEETGAQAVVPDMVWFYDDGQDHGALSAPNGDYRRLLEPMDAFVGMVRYKMGGFSLRDMELVQRIGYEDTYYDSCDTSVAKHHFFANKTARCNGRFYYRQNNANAITKRLSLTSYTSLYSFNEVLEFMEQHHFPARDIKQVARDFLSRRKWLARRLSLVEPDKQEQAKRILADTLRTYRSILLRNRLIIMWLKSRKWGGGNNKSFSLKRWIYHTKIREGRKITRILCFTFRGKKPPYVTKNGIFVPAMPQIKNIGRHSYCGEDLVVINPHKTSIGSFVSIGKGVQLGHGEHPMSYLSTSPYFYFDNLGFKTSSTPSHNEYYDQAPITIGSDVWIGDYVYVKNGIHIGTGAVIGARSVVTKDVPPYAIVVGAPAKIVRYRFTPSTIAELLESKWWDLPDELIKQMPYESPRQALDFLKHQ